MFKIFVHFPIFLSDSPLIIWAVYECDISLFAAVTRIDYSWKQRLPIKVDYLIFISTLREVLKHGSGLTWSGEAITEEFVVQVKEIAAVAELFLPLSLSSSGFAYAAASARCQNGKRRIIYRATCRPVRTVIGKLELSRHVTQWLCTTLSTFIG